MLGRAILQQRAVPSRGGPQNARGVRGPTAELVEELPAAAAGAAHVPRSRPAGFRPKHSDRHRRAADPDASPSSLVNRSTHPGRPRQRGARSPARCAAHRGERRASANSCVGTSPRAKRADSRSVVRPRLAAAETGKPPLGSLTEPGKPGPRPRRTRRDEHAAEPRSSPHRRPPRWRARRFRAIRLSPKRNRKLWGEFGISLSIRSVVQSFIHTCCTAQRARPRRHRRAMCDFRSKSVS